MKYALRGITAEEISYSMNRIKVDPNQRFEIKPQFTRGVKRVKENDKLYFLTLEVKIEATEEEVDAKVAEQAASVNKTAEEYKKNMDPRQFDYIRSDIVITKLFDFLKANNEMYKED